MVLREGTVNGFRIRDYECEWFIREGTVNGFRGRSYECEWF